MKTLAKSALGAAVAAAVATTSVQAAESVTMDPSLTFTYKNFYFDENGKNSDNHQGASDYEASEWAHSLIADFDSGYVNDLIGAVVTVGYAGPLKIKEGENYSASNVAGEYADADGDNINELVGSNAISGFQQAYLKARHIFSGVELAGSVGVKKRSTETYSDSGSRILAASSNGYDLSASFSGATAYYTEIKGFSDRNDSAFSNDLSVGSEDDGNLRDVKNIRIFGANYAYEGFSLAGEYGRSKGALKQTLLKVGYSLDLGDSNSVDLDARYGTAKEDEQDSLSATERFLYDGYKSKFYNVNATLNYGPAYVGVGYNKTKDGEYVDNYVNSNNDNFNSSLAQWEDYSKEGEKAYLVNAGYNFADQGLAGLSWDLWYAKGSGADGFSEFKRREYGSSVSYAFDGTLDGLSIAWLYVNYRASGVTDSSNTNANTDGLYDENVNRLYLTYTISAF